jgi:hypothetical protein
MEQATPFAQRLSKNMEHDRAELPASPPAPNRVLSHRFTLHYVAAAGLDHFLRLMDFW